jgi:hypothetical protein
MLQDEEQVVEVRSGSTEPRQPLPIERPPFRQAGQTLFASARLETNAKLRRDYLSPADRQQAGTMAERVRSEAPSYMQEVGAGGELVPASKLCENSRALHFRDTVQRPDLMAVESQSGSARTSQ